MKNVRLMALVIAMICGMTSCKQIRSSLESFSETEDESSPSSESLANAEGLPVMTSFSTIGEGSIEKFAGAGDRISVVEFYSDT